MTRETRALTRAAAAALMLAAAFAAHAVVPGQVNYQGLLLDDQGDPVTATVAMDFALYDAASEGSSLWSEAHPTVQVVDGIYHVVLGETMPLDPGVLAGGSLFLEVTVDGDTLTPRQALLAVPYALRAQDSEQLGGLSAEAFTQMYQHFAFDGQNPPNDDPSEGLADVDGDGLANFVDPDNDGDGFDDAEELAKGYDINLVTPEVGAFVPPTADGYEVTTVEVQGVNFGPGLTVQFGSQNPVPQNLTPTSFEIDVGPQPEGTVPVMLQLPGEDSFSTSYDFFFLEPLITGFSPPESVIGQDLTITVTGQNFIDGMTVGYGGQSPTPQNITPTSFDMDVLGTEPSGPVTTTVTLPNGESTMSTDFGIVAPSIVGFIPSVIGLGEPETIQILGAGFGPGATVQFGSQSLVPTSISPTSITIDVAGVEPPGVVSVTVTATNGEFATSSQMEVVEPPDGTIVFVTSSRYTGDLGGLAGADALCDAHAAAGALPGSYHAWLSDSLFSPSTREVMSGEAYVRPDAVVVANDWADLTDGSLLAPINVDETGFVRSDEVWTDVAAIGAGAAGSGHCADWSGTVGAGGIGGSVETDSDWTEQGAQGCNQLNRLYCIQQP